MSTLKRMQKLFAVLLVFTFVAGIVAVPGSAYAAKREPMRNLEIDVQKLISDIEDDDVEEAVLRLNAFGIIEGMEDGKYHPENKLTREQFAKILVTSLKMDHAAKAGVGYKSFPDVPADRWSAGFVGVAAGQGLIQGYPDGTFKPTKEVTYAEAVTMLVRALGYKDEFLPGSWPGNYLAKGAEKDITKKVRFSDAAGIVNRAEAALLVNNTLDAKVIKIDQYEGTIVKHYESEKTLLEDRLDIIKAEDARMIATKRVDDGLKWEEVRVYFTKDVKVPDTRDEYEFREDEKETFEIVKGYNPEELLGEEVTIYLNDDDELVYAESEHDDKAYFDYVEEIEDDDRLSLVKFDDDYPFDDDAYVYIKSGDKVKEIRIDKDTDYDKFVGKVGKVVVNNNKIVWAELMESGEVEPWFIVKKNDDGFLTGISADNEEAEVDLREDEDYDGIIALDIYGGELDVEDIEEGDLIYVQKQELDSDDYAVVRVVKDNVVEGKLGKVKHDRIEIGDDEIKVVKYTLPGENQDYDAYYSVDDGEDIKNYDLKGNTEVSDDMEDADDEDIVAYLDAVGRIAYFQTAASSTSGYKYGVVTRVYMDNDRLKIFTIDEDGEDDEIVYRVEEEENVEKSARYLNKYGQKLEESKYEDGKNQTSIEKGSVVKFKLNKAGEIAEDKLYVHQPENLWVINSKEDFGKDYLPKAYKLDSTAIKGVTKDSDKAYGDSGLEIEYSELKDQESHAFSVKDDVVIIDAETYRFDGKSGDDTVGFDSYHVEMHDTGDFSASKWEDLKEANGIDGLFYVFSDDDRKTNAKAAIFIGQGSGAASDDEIGIYVIDKWEKGGDTYVEYHEFDGEVQEREVDNDEVLGGKEHPYIAKVKSNGKLEIIKPGKSKDGFKLLTGVITDKDSRTIEVQLKDEKDSTTYSISNKTLVYDEDDKKTTSSLRKGHKIEFVVEKGTNVRVIGIVDELKDLGGLGGSEGEGVVTYINAGIEDGKLVLADDFADQTIKVRYNNDTKDLVVFEEGKIKVYVTKDGTQVAGLVETNAGIEEVNAKSKRDIISIDVTNTDLTPGKYEVKTMLNGKLQDEVLVIEVQSTDASLDFTKTKLAGVTLTDGTTTETGADEANAMPVTVNIAYSNGAAAALKAVTTDDNATVKAYADNGDGGGTYKEVAASYDFSDENTTLWIEVTAEDGETKLYYKVTVTVDTAGIDATLKSIRLNGVALEGFLSATEDYTVELEAGTTKVPTVSAVAEDANANVTVTQAKDLDENNVATIVVTAEDGETTKTYTITFTVEE